jgi:DNA-binding PadR family transcriptional regulator
LVKDGYARSRSVTQAERPDKTLYKITPAGRRVLDGWLTHVDPDDRAAFQLRLFVGALTDDDVLVRHVEAFRDDTAARHAEYRAIEPTNTRSGPDFDPYLLLRRGIQQAELDLEWADWVLRSLRRPHA